MRKIRVNLIVVLVVVAMIALLVIQAFQTRQLYDKKSGQFNDEVQTTMERIAVRHEKAEDVRKFFQIANTNFSGQYKDILKEEFQNLLSVEESITIKDTTIIENGEFENYLIIQGESFDSLSGLTTQQRVLARDIRQLRDLYQSSPTISSDSLDIAIQLDQKIIKKMFEKAKFVNEMMIQAFRESVEGTTESRLDIVFLDSVMRTEFQDDNLPDDFTFVVTNEQNKAIGCSKQLMNYDKSLDLSKAYKTNLFPSNLFGEDLQLNVFFPTKKSVLFREMWLPLSVNMTLVILIIWALIFMFRTILTQKKLAEMRNDFISNMTHEFKTPISTISLACQAMEDPDMIGKEGHEQTKPYVKMINDENKRLGMLVERILQSAVLDRGEVNLRKEKILVNEVIHEVLHNAQFRVKKLDGSIHLEMDSELVYIEADRMHFTNVISNLVDNAIKYSPESPNVTVNLQHRQGHIRIAVIDKGLGIKKEHLNKIFDKLYRIPTGNVHNVKGFGLGLSYVKAICDLHGWKINVQSRYGEGSTFSIDIKQ